MNVEAAAEALATDTPVVEAEKPAVTEPTLDDQLSEVFDNANQEDVTNPPADAAPEEEVVEEQPVEEPVSEQAPTALPRAIRDSWSNIPEGAREAIAARDQEMTSRLADQGRLIQGISPIRDVLVEATKKLPALANMKPQDVASEVMQLAEISNKFTTDPAGTLIGLIKQHGLEKQVAQTLTGQEVTGDAKQSAALTQHIKKLEADVKRLADPKYIREHAAQVTTEAQNMERVTKFAETADHWGAVEDHMPAAIQFTQAKLGPGASPEDVLTQAYELAVSQFVPEAKAKPQTTEEVVTVADPEKVEAQKRAKSVNVKGKASGQPRPQTEEELMDSVWRKHNA